MYLLEFELQHVDDLTDDNGNGSSKTDADPRKPLKIVLREFGKGEVPPYAILSHRWGRAEDEVSFRDMMYAQNDDNPQHSLTMLHRKRKAFDKIENCCRQAMHDGLAHAWVDTCCIDKSSSAELSEALNSMFEWYGWAKICYVYMEDVESRRDDEGKVKKEDHSAKDSSFRASRWFTRGWTLQEMIAPLDVRFYARDWVEIGRKREMTDLLREITRVAKDVLVHPHAVKNVCVSQKMYWASNRETTRLEDRAYSLLGLFGISMPILYGEGSRAFARLQEEIIRSSFDHTIFAWRLSGRLSSGLLANSPSEFAYSGMVRPMSQREFDRAFGHSKLDYSVTNLGVHIQLLHRRIRSHKCLYIAFLACRYGTRITPISIYLRRHSDNASEQYFRTRKVNRSIGDGVNVSSRDRDHFQSQAKIWVAPPEEDLIWRLRPLIRDELAVKLESDDLKDVQAYCLRVFHQGENLTVCPAADHARENEFTVETVEGRVTIAKIRLRYDCVVWLLLAVVGGKLVSHLEHERSLPSEELEPSFDTAESIRSCKAFYDRCIASHNVPCTEAVWRPSQMMNKKKPLGITNSANDIIQLREESFVDTYERKMTFAVWLRLELNLDFGDMVMLKPEPGHKKLRGLLRSCQPLFRDDVNKGNKSNTASGSFALTDSSLAPVLASDDKSSDMQKSGTFTADADIHRSSDINLEIVDDKPNTRFGTGHAAVKDLSYLNGYRKGLSEGRKQGADQGEQHGNRLMDHSFSFPRIRKLDEDFEAEGLLKDLRQVHRGVVTVYVDKSAANGEEGAAERFYYDCPCFNKGFAYGYDCGRHWAIKPLLIGRHAESHICAFSRGYTHTFWRAYYFTAVDLLAGYGHENAEDACRCAAAYAKGHAVGFSAGNASGRAERFGGTKRTRD